MFLQFDVSVLIARLLILGNYANIEKSICLVGKVGVMAITGDHYVAEYDGHTIELVRNNWNKTLKLLIDGEEVASASVALPHDVTLTGMLDQHTVTGKSLTRFPRTEDSIEVDGMVLPVTKKK